MKGGDAEGTHPDPIRIAEGVSIWKSKRIQMETDTLSIQAIFFQLFIESAFSNTQHRRRVRLDVVTHP